MELKLINAAIESYSLGHIHKTELICRELLDRGCREPIVYGLMALISCDIGEAGFAKSYVFKFLETGPSQKSCNDPFAEKLLEQSANTHTQHPKISATLRQCPEFEKKQNRAENFFLLIQAWGFGFFADLDHVLGQLLIAEMTGRTPVVHWGANSLYRTEDTDNAFDLYFEPLSDHSINDLMDNNYTFFPPKWNENNLLSKEVNKWKGPFSTLPGILFLNRPENVVVSDFHTALNDLIPWINKDHHLYGLNRAGIYRYLVNKYIKFKSDIYLDIENFHKEKMIGREPLLAVHIRGGNKIDENEDIRKINDIVYHKYIEQYLVNYPAASIFLLTNDSRIKDGFELRYPEKLIFTTCKRTDKGLDAHYFDDYNRYFLGLEIIRDTMLALKCDHFIGYAWSKVSCMVSYLKEWEPGTCVLLGDDLTSEKMFFESDVNMFMPMKLFIKGLNYENTDI